MLGLEKLTTTVEAGGLERRVGEEERGEVGREQGGADPGHDEAGTVDGMIL